MFWGSNSGAQKNNFEVFYSQLCSNKSSGQWFHNALFRNGLEDKNDKKEKKMRQKYVKVKEKIAYKSVLKY